MSETKRKLQEQRNNLYREATKLLKTNPDAGDLFMEQVDTLDKQLDTME
jgi:hypothetical protein